MKDNIITYSLKQESRAATCENYPHELTVTMKFKNKTDCDKWFKNLSKYVKNEKEKLNTCSGSIVLGGSDLKGYW